MRFLKMKRVWIPLLVILLILFVFTFFRKDADEEELPTSRATVSAGSDEGRSADKCTEVLRSTAGGVPTYSQAVAEAEALLSTSLEMLEGASLPNSISAYFVGELAGEANETVGAQIGFDSGGTDPVVYVTITELGTCIPPTADVETIDGRETHFWESADGATQRISTVIGTSRGFTLELSLLWLAPFDSRESMYDVLRSWREVFTKA